MAGVGHRRRMGAGLVFLCVLPVLSGCNFFVADTNSGGGGSTGNSVYVLNATTNTVGGFAIGTSTLAVLSGSPYALGFTPQAGVVSRNNTFLYIAGPGTVTAYTIASNGSLSQSGCTGCTVVSTISSLDVSPDGQWLVGLDQVSQTIDLWALNASTGAMTAQNPAAYTTNGTTVVRMQVRFSPAGNFVIAALGTGGDVIFPFDTSTGGFSTTYGIVTTGSTQSSDNAIAINSTGTAFYVARSGTNSGVLGYTLTSSGAPSIIAGSPYAAGTTPTAVQIDNANRYVYAANRVSGTISAYTISTTGALTAITGSPYTSGALVGSLGADSTGKYVLASASGGSPDLTMYSFDATTAGKLNSVATVATSADPAGATTLALTH